MARPDSEIPYLIQVVREVLEFSGAPSDPRWSGLMARLEAVVSSIFGTSSGEYARMQAFNSQIRNDGFGLPSAVFHSVKSNYCDEWSEKFETGKGIVRMSVDVRNVFVVHGRDLARKRRMFELLRAVGLNPLDWEEMIRKMRSSSPYIGEVISYGLSVAQSIVVLMTGDDLAKLKEEFCENPSEGKLAPQARPNVLVEMGMALAIDRNRTIIAEYGQLRGVSDIHGLNTVRVAGDIEQTKRLLNRLEAAGHTINWNSEWERYLLD
jgi:predicted nucleotide-binding protein